MFFLKNWKVVDILCKLGSNQVNWNSRKKQFSHSIQIYWCYFPRPRVPLCKHLFKKHQLTWLLVKGTFLPYVRLFDTLCYSLGHILVHQWKSNSAKLRAKLGLFGSRSGSKMLYSTGFCRFNNVWSLLLKLNHEHDLSCFLLSLEMEIWAIKRSFDCQCLYCNKKFGGLAYKEVFLLCRNCEISSYF